MGVVRREGPWRLEKREAGVYEVTYQQKPQERILTPDAKSQPTAGGDLIAIPVHRVDSYSEAEGRFEERVHSDPPMDFGTSSGFGEVPDPGQADIDSPEPDLGEVDLESTSPGAVALGLFLVGGIFLWTGDLDTSSPVFVIGAGAVILASAIIGWAFFATEELNETLSYLADSTDEASKMTEDKPEKTPQASEKLKNDLYFDRAEQSCEWCGADLDQPEIHHIVPRREGGPNERSNLIVLCPNHHRKADAGAISRSKLKAKVRRQEDSG